MNVELKKYVMLPKPNRLSGDCDIEVEAIY
jgi:hypothetical protein